MSSAPARRARSEERLRQVPWRALQGICGALEVPIAEVLEGAPAERVLDRTLRGLRGLDRARRGAIAEALFGVGLWRLRLAYHLGDDAAPPRSVLAALLRDLGGLEGSEAEDVAGLGRGALPPPRRAPADLATRFSLPPWLAATLRDEAGEEAEALADALDLPGPVTLRPNLLRVAPGELARRLGAEGVPTRPGALVPTALVVTAPHPNLLGTTAWREALFEVQDEGSQLAGAAIEARAGQTVLDLCAGAGGKTLQLAAAVGPSGAVHASDPDGERLGRLRRRAERAGAAPIVRVDGPSPAPALRADGVLVDAPCSELGALRRGPDQRFRIDPARFGALPPLQRALLRRGAGHVRPGGRLVYATCTIRRDENEDVADAFERAHPAFGRALTVRTWPHRDGCDGFFVAAWTRRG